jgi:hypothetical protein
MSFLLGDSILGDYDVGLVLEVEPDRELEVYLDGSALARSFKCVIQLYVDLRSIESSITRVYFPGLSEEVKSSLKSSFSSVPQSIISQLIFRSRRQLQLVVESEKTIDMVQKV